MQKKYSLKLQEKGDTTILPETDLKISLVQSKLIKEYRKRCCIHR